MYILNKRNSKNFFVFFKTKNFIFILILYLVIELACGEYGEDKIQTMVTSMQNGQNLEWMNDYERLPDLKTLRGNYILHCSQKYSAFTIFIFIISFEGASLLAYTRNNRNLNFLSFY